MNQNMQTVAETVRKRIERLKKQESNLDNEIARIQKRIEDLPNLKQRLEELKAKKKQVATRKEKELADIEELTKLVKTEA